MKALSIAGYGSQRDIYDFYRTPPAATEALFEREHFTGEVWECASGDGSMSRVIERYNPCYSSDIRTDDLVYGERNVDFLNNLFLPRREVENIITNPPYRWALEFVLQAKEVASHKVAMLLKLVFLESTGRYAMFQDKDFPLKTVYVFCRRVNIHRNGVVSRNVSMLAFAWFVWERGWGEAPTTIRWIS